MIPKNAMWLSYGDKIHFILDEESDRLICKKWINNQAYTIDKELPKSISELNTILNRFVNLPDEFWKPVE